MRQQLFGLFADLAAARPDLPVEDVYSGRFASLYDTGDSARLGDVPQVSAVADLLSSHLQRPLHILELGCGSGRLLLPLAERGHEVTGIDRSTTMLRLARSRLAAAPTGTRELVTLRRDDMSEFELPKRFDLILLPINNVALLPNVEARQRTFAGAAAHLAEAGVFLVDHLLPGREVRGDRDVRAHVDLDENGHERLVLTGQRFEPASDALLLNVFVQTRGCDPDQEWWIGTSRKQLIDPQDLRRELDASGFVVVRSVRRRLRGPLGEPLHFELLVTGSAPT